MSTTVKPALFVSGALSTQPELELRALNWALKIPSGSFALMRKEAVRFPALVGLQNTLMLSEPPGGIVLGKALLPMANWLACVPCNTTLVMVMFEMPEL